jgi:hypothetical protein
MASISQRIFFVDASIIVLYQTRIREDLVSFIDNSKYRFLYTETIRNKIQNRKLPIPSNFVFVQSDVSERTKEWSLKFLNHIWVKEFGDKALSNDIERFREDLSVVIEVGSMECDKYFLTSNARLYNKFFREKEIFEFMRESISLVGLELPTEINLVDRVIEKWVI